MLAEIDLETEDGRTLQAYDTGGGARDGRLATFWHHSSPNVGAPPEPLFPTADRLDIRWVSYDRPGYGGSTPRPDRDVAQGVDRFAVVGHSSGGSHALACAALLRERVLGAVVVAGMAPFSAEGLDWFEGLGPALFLHGGRDRIVPGAHGAWLARRCPSAELWRYPENGHISVLNHSPAAMAAGLREHARGS